MEAERVSSPPTVLASAVDTLWLTTTARPRPEVLQALERCKAEAVKRRAAGISEPVLWEYLLDEQAGEMEVRPYGTAKAAYVLESENWTLQVHPNAPKGIPTAYVELRSQFLWALGHRQAGALALDLLGLVCFGELDAQVSRIDLCADVGFWNVRPEMVREFKGRAAKRDSHFELYHQHETFTGFLIGRGGVITCGLYNKSRELKKSGKLWLRPRWRQGGLWRDEERDGDVWRLEYRLSRDMLRDARIGRHAGEVLPDAPAVPEDPGLLKSWPAAAECLAPTWLYLTSSWLSWRLPRTNRQRVRFHPDWQRIRQGANFPGQLDSALFRRLLERRKTNTWGQLAGYLKNALVIDRQRGAPEDISLEEAIGRATLGAISHYEEKHGERFTDAVRESYRRAELARRLLGDSDAQLEAFVLPKAKA